jgi:hypothetical protein
MCLLTYYKFQNPIPKNQASKTLRSKPTHMNKQIINALQELKGPYSDIIDLSVCLHFLLLEITSAYATRTRIYIFLHK